MVDARITRSSAYTGRLYVHQFRVRAPGELDDEFAGWIHEAFQVGNGAHLGRGPIFKGTVPGPCELPAVEWTLATSDGDETLPSVKAE